jgi:hypothetical protein
MRNKGKKLATESKREQKRSSWARGEGEIATTAGVYQKTTTGNSQQ